MNFIDAHTAHTYTPGSPNDSTVIGHMQKPISLPYAKHRESEREGSNTMSEVLCMVDMWEGEE